MDKSTMDTFMSAGFTVDDEQLRKFRSEITGVKENYENSAETTNVSPAKPSASLNEKRYDSPSLDPKWQSFLSDVFSRPDNESSPTPSSSTQGVSGPEKVLSRTQLRRLLRKKNRRLQRLMNAKEKLEKCPDVSVGDRSKACACPSAGSSHRVLQKDCSDSRKCSVQKTNGYLDGCMPGTNGLWSHLKSGTSKLSTDLVSSPSCSSVSNQKRGVKRPSSSIGCPPDQSSGYPGDVFETKSSDVGGNGNPVTGGSEKSTVQLIQGGGVLSKDNSRCDVGSEDDGVPFFSDDEVENLQDIGGIVKNKNRTPDVDNGAKTLLESDRKRIKLNSLPGSGEDTSRIFVSESEEDEVVVIYESGIKRSEIVKIVQETFGLEERVESDYDSKKGTEILDEVHDMHDRVSESNDNVSYASDGMVLTSNVIAKPISSFSDSGSDCEFISAKSVVHVIKKTPGDKSTSVSTPSPTSTVSSSVPSTSSVWRSKEKDNEASSSKGTKVTSQSSQSLQNGNPVDLLGDKPSTSRNGSSQGGRISPTPQPFDQRSRGVKRTIEELEHQRPCPEQYVALDCEFVGVGDGGRRSALGRCSIVDYYGNVVLDIYSRPEEPITDFRTRWSGIRPYHMRNAVPFESARRRIKQIIEGKIIIGHAIHNDLEVLKIAPPQENVRDTITSAKLKEMMGLHERQFGLKKMAKSLLDRSIQRQRGGHCSVEDARASLDLFRLIEHDWDGQLKGVKRRKREISESESYMDDAYWLFD